MNESTEMTTKTEHGSGTNLMSTAQNLTFCSFSTATGEGKAKLFNAMTNPDKRVADFINKQIEISDIYAETIQITNEDTGELELVPRCILIDSKGVTYVAVSKGVFGDLKRLIQIYGEPAEWEHPLKVEVKQIPVKAGSMLKLVLVS